MALEAIRGRLQEKDNKKKWLLRASSHSSDDKSLRILTIHRIEIDFYILKDQTE